MSEREREREKEGFRTSEGTEEKIHNSLCVTMMMMRWIEIVGRGKKIYFTACSSLRLR